MARRCPSARSRRRSAGRVTAARTSPSPARRLDRLVPSVRRGESHPPGAPMSETAEPKPTTPVLSGRIGKYEILRMLGKGAMGMVYVAHDTVLERDVALKVMGVHIADDETLKQRFMREAKAVAKMTHPNVVNVFDLGSHVDGSPYIAMELLHGE